MNYRRFALVAACACLLSAPAFSASVVMLQFGSFETRDEAQARLTEVKAKHADVLGGMDVSIREVKLPPDNLTVYRTQAGPLPSRAAAQSACAKLAGSGDECYVVETAMVASPSPAVAAAAAPSSTPSADSAAATAPAMAMDNASANATSTVPSLPAAHLSSNAVGNTPLNPPPAMDMAAPAAAADTAATPVIAPPSLGMQAAMDQAVANQQAMEAAPAPAPAPAPRPSFWSHLNPFSTTASATVAAAPAAAASADVAAKPIQTADAAPLAPMPMPAGAPADSSPMQPAPPPPVAQQMPPQPPLQPIPVQQSQPIYVTPGGMHLPPPPPPLMANGMAPSAPPQPMITPSSAPIQSQPLMPVANTAPAPIATPFRANPGIAAGNVDMASNGQGGVSVEEAKRVPLSTLPPTAPLLMQAPAQPPISLSPSATLGEKTMWAQISQFRDTQSALAFWDSYRQAHPDFPAVRVRSVSSLQQGGNGAVSLRVGPFAREASITNLCSSLADQNVMCGKTVDLGFAAAGQTIPGYLPGSRYNRQ